MKRVELSTVTGSLCDYAREGLSEPVLVTEHGRPVLAVMPLTEFDDRESVALATNAQFLAIVERSRASGRREGTRSLAEVRTRVGPARKQSRRKR